MKTLKQLYNLKQTNYNEFGTLYYFKFNNAIVKTRVATFQYTSYQQSNVTFT